MNTFLNIFIIIPLFGFLLSIFVNKKAERALSKIAFSTAGLQLVILIGFTIYWLFHQHHIINIKDLVVYKTETYEFFIDFSFDKITAVYGLVGAFLTFLVTIYSRYYLHREEGYKRFFNTILFFYLGYNIIVFSGNLETLFIGWEILGISSFLLIAFYRDRYLPVKNAFKVFSIYRIGDVGLILAMWMSHHLWHENITFLQLKNSELVHEHIANHSFVGFFIAIMLLIAAAAKSAQLPFSSWLPKAMEGPTPSSAIFYGSLSVHIGVFLLLRTFELWEYQTTARVIIILLGLTTSIVASGIAKVQSSIKSQIAYASIAQIGLIFIEVALGLDDLALIHFAGNAFLRTYQLLVSPSVVTYLIKEQFYNFKPVKKIINSRFSKTVNFTFYQLCLKEWNLDTVMYKLWQPLKLTGRSLDFLTEKWLYLIFIPSYIAGIILLYFEKEIPIQIHAIIPPLFAFIGFVMVLKSYTERRNITLAWVLIILNHLWIALAISFNEHYKIDETFTYISGISVAGILGYICLNKLKQLEQNISLNEFQGHIYEHPKIGFIFLLSCLGLAGFPITPTFIGEDLLFSHIKENQYLLAFFVASSLVVDGIAVMRIYAKLFLGPHLKTYHETPYKSS